MNKYLISRGWAGESQEALPACVLSYFVTCLKPALGERLTSRTSHEMETVAEALDHLLKGDLGKGMTVLMQRFKCLEMSTQDGSFDRAKHLGLIRPDQISNISDREADLARQNALLEKRLQQRPH